MDPESLPTTIAQIIHHGFDVFYARFKGLTRDCRAPFDLGQWQTVQDLNHQRIDLYQQYVGRTLTALGAVDGAAVADAELWSHAHRQYADAVAERDDVEVAETFFNAITRKIFRTVGVNREVEFLDRELDVPARPSENPLFWRVPGHVGPEAAFRRALSAVVPGLPWRDVHSDVRWLCGEFAHECRLRGLSDEFDELEVVRSLFFRVREGYIVGRIRRGESWTPWVVPVLSTSAGTVADGLILTSEALDPVFSATRSYFFVDVDKPSDLVGFLATLLPDLTLSELYISIAHHRHGKSLIYRELVDHLQSSDDQFVMAPGIPGLVMTVFTSPSYRNVFKVIRDRFDKPGASRAAIMNSYRDVFRGSRVGRLADTQEFEYLAFERRRFTSRCLNELLARAHGSIDMDEDNVVVRHLYIEEKMTPLNIYLAQASFDEARRAMVDYGDAIKELAANNIFAGDLLWKNFGVTRSGKLVLYDYDEICPLLACNFRAIPASASYDDELAEQRYYAVSDADVFPQEWEPFIVPQRDERLKAAFLAHHGDLFTPEFWRERQRGVRAGEFEIKLPYVSRWGDSAQSGAWEL